MNKKLEFIDFDILTIDRLYDAEECESLIQRAEAIGFEAASVRTSTGAKMLPKVRNNDRVNLTDPDLAMDMWNRIREFLPELDGEVPIAVDPNLRFYRYEPGQEFKRHKDGAVTNPAGQTSKLSFLVYLNEDFDGGSTNFRDYTGKGETRQRIEKVIVPQIGMALLFRHERWHEGVKLTRGRKYVLRSDIFYR